MSDKKKKKNNEDLVREYQNEKDIDKKKKIADELYNRVYKLILKMINLIEAKYISYVDLREDLLQEASLIFMKCINKFDTTKSIKFSTYLGDACFYELKRFNNNQMKHVKNNYDLEIDEIIMSKPENLEDKIDDEVALNKIKHALVKLNKEQKITDKQFSTIIEEHGFFGVNKKSRKQIAEERNCSLQNIGFLYRKALSKIREEINDSTQPKGENNG